MESEKMLMGKGNVKDFNIKLSLSYKRMKRKFFFLKTQSDILRIFSFKTNLLWF